MCQALVLLRLTTIPRTFVPNTLHCTATSFPILHWEVPGAFSVSSKLEEFCCPLNPLLVKESHTRGTQHTAKGRSRHREDTTRYGGNERLRTGSSSPDTHHRRISRLFSQEGQAYTWGYRRSCGHRRYTHGPSGTIIFLPARNIFRAGHYCNKSAPHRKGNSHAIINRRQLQPPSVEGHPSRPSTPRHHSQLRRHNRRHPVLRTRHPINLLPIPNHRTLASRPARHERRRHPRRPVLGLRGLQRNRAGLQFRSRHSRYRELPGGLHGLSGRGGRAVAVLLRRELEAKTSGSGSPAHEQSGRIRHRRRPRRRLRHPAHAILLSSQQR
ncbi:hypothetical protein M8818_000897 [Zalaria obscura]|uniref:Uncharacterized protein n=1 Tax=Zalaria obscura TaxID=2024903 RepID=A0ACC3SN60_9PEZI